MRLLLVENGKRMAEALTERLRLEKYEVDLCREGNSGMDAVLTGWYDVVVPAVMLPEKNGFEIAGQGRRPGIKAPILMLTGRFWTSIMGKNDLFSEKELIKNASGLKDGKRNIWQRLLKNSRNP